MVVPWCLFALYEFLFTRSLREALNNHVIVVLLLIDLFIETITFPLMITYYGLSGNLHASPPYSQLWSYTILGFFPTQTIVFAWCTIERHILVFHNHWFTNKRNRIFLHYIPLIIVPLYCFIYFAVSLSNIYPICAYLNIQSTVLGIYAPCFAFIVTHFKVDLILHQIMPILIIIISTFALFYRFLRQKARARQPVELKKQRKLIVQAVSIFIIFGIFQFPWIIVKFCGLFGLSFPIVENYMTFLQCYVIFLFPFVCLGTIPDIGKKMKIFLCCKNRQQRIGPDQTQQQNTT